MGLLVDVLSAQRLRARQRQKLIRARTLFLLRVTGGESPSKVARTPWQPVRARGDQSPHWYERTSTEIELYPHLVITVFASAGWCS